MCRVVCKWSALPTHPMGAWPLHPQMMVGPTHTHTVVLRVTKLIPVRHSGGLPFRRSARVNPNPNPDPRNGGPPEWGAGTDQIVHGNMWGRDLFVEGQIWPISEVAGPCPSNFLVEPFTCAHMVWQTAASFAWWLVVLCPLQCMPLKFRWSLHL